MASSVSSAARNPTLDVARGTLLLAMVGVHVLSAHGTAAQVSALHDWFGVFLISSGFVALSGYVAAMRGGTARWGDAAGSGRTALHLLLVMVAYGALLSLGRLGLSIATGGPEACTARFGWSPPLRFEDLGILLPIALVQVHAPLARGSGRWKTALLAALALGWMLLPTWTAGVSGHGLGPAVVAVLTRRSLTPYYVVSMFVGLGIAGLIAGRMRWAGGAAPGRPWPAALLLAASLLLAIPPVADAAIGPAYRWGGPVGGAAATTLYWLAVIVAFLRGCALLLAAPPWAHRTLALLGRHSLLVFVLHDGLLAFDEAARQLGGWPKGIPFVAGAALLNAAVLIAAAYAVERRDGLRTAARALLLDRSRPAGGPRPVAGTAFTMAALAGVLAVYTGSHLAHASDVLQVDDFESRANCPPWWTFGGLQYLRRPALPSEPGHGAQVLEVRGRARGAACGMGLYCVQDIGTRRTLELDVRGYGPASGRVRIELYVDDNGNWEIEKDANYNPLYDDRFVYEFDVDWTGWRRLRIPASLFRDDNPGIGTGVFTPQRDMTSGGLLQIQFLFRDAPEGDGNVRLDLDNLSWAP